VLRAQQEESEMNSRLKLSVVATLSAVFLFAPAPSRAQITPSQDAYTNSAAATTNYGAAGALGVANTAGSIQTSYIQFDLSAVPAGFTGANIAKATLKLYVDSVTTAGSFNLDYVNGTWAERTLNQNNIPALGGTIQASVPLSTASKSKYVEINVTTALRAWLNGMPNNGLAIVANSPLTATFDSKESSTQSHPPELDVVFNGAITGITTTSGSGLTGGGTAGNLGLSLSTSCSAGQALIWSGSVWVCKTPVGSGTVSSVGLTAPSADFTIAGSPVTGAGTLGLGWKVAPTSANTANSIVKRDATGSFNTANITATGQITVHSSASLNPISVTASAPGAAAIAAFSTGTGLTDGVIGSAISSTKAASGVIGIDQNTGVSGSYTTGVTGVTDNSYGVGVLGYGSLSSEAQADIGYGRVGVWGDDASGTGVVATSDSGIALIATNANVAEPTISAVNNATGTAIEATDTSIVHPTLLAVNNATASNGVIFRASAPKVTSNGSAAFCEVRTSGSLGCTGDVYQNTGGNGLIKALVYVDPAQPAGSQIVRCFNSTIAEPGASTPPCGFTFSYGLLGLHSIDFAFTVSNRFVQITADLTQINGRQVGAFVQADTDTSINIYTFYSSTNERTDEGFYLTVF
jgi:hypothetical protein